MFSLLATANSFAAGCTAMLASDTFMTIAGSQESPDYGAAGLRVYLQKSVAEAGLACDWVGDNAIGFDHNDADGFEFDPDMVGGGTLYADELSKVIGEKVLQYQPKLFVLYVGSDDVLSQIVPNGPGTSLQPPWLAALDVALVVDTVHVKAPEAPIVVMVPVTGINHNALLEELRTNILSLMIERTFVKVIDTGRLVIAPEEYVSLKYLNEDGAKKAADALFVVTQPIFEGLNAPTPVPAPAAGWLLGSALCGLVMMRRRTKV